MKKQRYQAVTGEWAGVMWKNGTLALQTRNSMKWVRGDLGITYTLPHILALSEADFRDNKALIHGLDSKQRIFFFNIN